ncbi:MAG: hypothetical protein O7H41_10185, partial [Planctomycetota bacterium]|nr:hypothetical protein [Planctomycetota bacterium]
MFELQKALALSVLRDFYPLGRSAGFKRDVYPKQSSASEVAIVIGVAGYREPTLQGLANFGVADASSFLEFLRQREGSALKEEGTRLLLGAGATREEIFGAFRKYDLDGTQ